MVVTTAPSRSEPDGDTSVASQSEVSIRKCGGVQKWLVILSALLISFPFLQVLPFNAEAQPLFLFSILLWVIVRFRTRIAFIICLGLLLFPLSIGIFFLLYHGGCRVSSGCRYTYLPL